MNGNTKVVFSVGLGMGHEEHEFTLGELGYDPEIHIDIEKFLEEEWREWKNDRVDGNFRLESDEG